MRRYIRIIFLSIFAVFAFSSCSQEQLGVIAASNDADNKEIHFLQSSITKEFPQDTKTGVIPVTLARNGNKGTYRVILKSSGKNAGLFTVKDTVVIPDGHYSVDVPVKVNMSGVMLGSSVKVSLYIAGRDCELGEDSAYISQYEDFLDVSASYQLEWEPYMRKTESGEMVQQTATYQFNLFYDGWQSGIPVEIAKGTDNIFRLVDWAETCNLMFKVDWAKKKVTVPAQSIGYYEESLGTYVYVSDVAEYVGDSSMYDYYPCTWDGDRTFSLSLIYYYDGTDYVAGYNKIETLTFAGDHDTDPAVTVTYKGDGKFAFEYNDYTSLCRAVVVDGDISGDAKKIKTVADGISLGKAENVREFSDKEQIWTPESTLNTLVVVPFDDKGKPGEASAVRFTYDPDRKVLPKILECVLAPHPEDPYTTVKWDFRVSSVASARFIMLPKEVWDYYKKQYDMELLFSRLGGSFPDDKIAEANSDEGMHVVWDVEEGNEYSVFVEVKNSLGDTLTFETSAKMQTRADKFEDKSIDDFVGMYLMSATVSVASSSSGQSSSSEAFRVDVIKTGRNTVSIRGLCNDASYSLEIKGTYIPEKHCIRVETQNLGEYSYMDVVFGFTSDLWTAVRDGKSSMEFGFCDDGYVHWRATEGSEKKVNGYKFMLMDGSSYSGYDVAYKSYSNLLMMKM